MGVNERDSHTGHATTGHEWNGIRELNTAVPKLVWYFLAATVIFSVVYWVLMPAWPLGSTYTKGLLGTDTRRNLATELRETALQRGAWTKRIESESLDTIQSDQQLMTYVRDTGRTLFGDNCAVCHGTRAAGGPGFPALVDEAWLWGGSPEAVLETIRVGINSEHPETRVSQMPAFGRDGMLDRRSVLDVVAYVRSLSHPVKSATASSRGDAAKEIFASNCSSCHGEDAKGNTDMGAPDLTDDAWIYGGDEEAIYRTVYGGRQGHMPAWESRLTSAELKILALYVLDLGRGDQ